LTNLLLAAGLLLAAPAGQATLPGPDLTTGPATGAGPVAAPRVIMLRLYAADIARAEKFYNEVLGANVVQRMGDKVRIMVFPGGTLPGIILIQSPDEARMNGSFVIQVPDVQATLQRAAANGGAPINTRFAQNIEGMAANSSHFTDPDGNIVEALQIGASPS
jgi:predicted enzyme related to lactoylglutathione lyase